MCTKLMVLLLALALIIPVTSRAGDYVIGEGDTLDISVWGVKELSFPAKVRPDGKITVQGLGDVAASGQTPTALQASLSLRLKQLVKNPIVTVSVTGITNSKVYIFGGGVPARVFDLLQRSTLLQLLCSLGEVRSADLKKAYLLRDGKKIKENFYGLFIEGDTASDVQLEPGDSLWMPLLTDKSVYVLGAVNTPRAIEYREGMTVMEAILEAGGFTKFASRNNTQIRRKGVGADETITIRAKEIIQEGNMQQNAKLKPGDYIIVDESIF